MGKTFFWIGILLAFIFTFPPIQDAAEVRGVTDTEVVIGWTTPLSGPAGLPQALSRMRIRHRVPVSRPRPHSSFNMLWPP